MGSLAGVNMVPGQQWLSNSGNGPIPHSSHSCSRSFQNSRNSRAKLLPASFWTRSIFIRNGKLPSILGRIPTKPTNSKAQDPPQAHSRSTNFVLGSYYFAPELACPNAPSSFGDGPKQRCFTSFSHFFHQTTSIVPPPPLIIPWFHSWWLKVPDFDDVVEDIWLGWHSGASFSNILSENLCFFQWVCLLFAWSFFTKTHCSCLLDRKNPNCYSDSFSLCHGVPLCGSDTFLAA